MVPVLEKLWNMEEYLGHSWWEQGAMMHLLGYSTDGYTRRVLPTDLYARTHFLPLKWNYSKTGRGYARPVFWHVFNTVKNRLEVIRRLAGRSTLTEVEK